MGFEIIDIRRFVAQDFAPLLDAESHAWREGLRWDFTSSARVVSTCLQEKRLSGYALVFQGKVQGYCFFFYDGEKGLIGDLFVDPSSAGLEQALRLLEHVIETLLATPGLRRVEAQLPHFGFEQLEPCFHTSHFEGYRRRFMALSLLHGPLAHAKRGSSSLNDFLIVPWERKHDHEAAELVYDTYCNHVDTIINDQYGSLAGATRLIENIIHQHGCGEYLPHLSHVALHRSSQRLAGILAVTAVLPDTAHIPQVAIARPFQGCGLGTLLMELSFEDLARQGYQQVSLTVTDQNAGALRLYERLGFETFRTFGAFVFNRS